MKRLAYRDLKHVFGDPDTYTGRKQIRSTLKSYKLPFPFYNEQKGKVIEITHITCQEYIGPDLIAALREILEHYGLDNIKAMGLDKNFGGCGNRRKTRDGKWWSVHTWYAAVDLWTHLGKMGAIPTIPPFCVEAFKERGFYWGGDFKTPDGMHFSVCFG